MTIQWSISE